MKILLCQRFFAKFFLKRPFKFSPNFPGKCAFDIGKISIIVFKHMQIFNQKFGKFVEHHFPEGKLNIFLNRLKENKSFITDIHNTIQI